jgi:hypothetical protein
MFWYVGGDTGEMLFIKAIDCPFQILCSGYTADANRMTTSPSYTPFEGNSKGH